MNDPFEQSYYDRAYLKRCRARKAMTRALGAVAKSEHAGPIVRDNVQPGIRAMTDSARRISSANPVEK